MAIVVDTTLCPLLIEAGFTTTQIKNQVVLKRESLGWWGSQLSQTDRRNLCLAIWNIMTTEGPQNCGTSYDISRRLGYPEPLVSDVMSQILSVAFDIIEQYDAGER